MCLYLVGSKFESISEVETLLDNKYNKITEVEILEMKDDRETIEKELQKARSYDELFSLY